MSEDTKLLPCPFCGGSAELTKRKGGGGSNGYYSVGHMCTSYLSIVCCGDTAELAAEKWNRRVGPPRASAPTVWEETPGTNPQPTEEAAGDV